MDTLDLHGVRHNEAEQIIEDFVLTCELPADVIVGNSIVMNKILNSVLKRHGLGHWYKNSNNLGCVTVLENPL